MDIFPTAKLYIVSLMNDKKDGVIAGLVKIVLHLMSYLYRGALNAVDWSYLSGLKKEHDIPVPVISVGNITLGGTGKTPFTVYIADHFSATGKKPAVLMRGYGDDEHKMLSDTLPDIRVYPGRNRLKKSRDALKDGADLMILDDGYQHRKIRRDLNILLLDCPAPFGNGFLFPRGILREPVSAVKRADIVIITKSDSVDREQKDRIVNRVKGLVPGIPVLTAAHEPVSVSDITGNTYSLEVIRGKRICAVSGIADPGYFEFTIKKTGGIPSKYFRFPDHYCYSQRDIDRIYAGCLGANSELILVTGKDFVKMKTLDLSRVRDKLVVLNIKIEITEGEERLIAGLDSSLHGKGL